VNSPLQPASENPEAEITDAHRDVAAALQECLDKVMLHICGHWGRATGLRPATISDQATTVDLCNPTLEKNSHLEDRNWALMTYCYSRLAARSVR
jgi:hypothetical protein